MRHLARTRASREQRREQVAEAARKIMVEQGPDKLTTEAIGLAVGLSDGGIFRHFKNKEEIVLQVLEEYEASLVNMLVDLQERPGSALHKVETLFRMLLSNAEHRGPIDYIILSWSLLNDTPTLAQRARKTVEVQHSAVEDFLRLGQVEGSVLPGINLERAASLFLNMVHGQIRWWTLQCRSYPLTDVCDDLWMLYRRAVQTTPTLG